VQFVHQMFAFRNIVKHGKHAFMTIIGHMQLAFFLKDSSAMLLLCVCVCVCVCQFQYWMPLLLSTNQSTVKLRLKD